MAFPVKESDSSVTESKMRTAYASLDCAWARKALDETSFKSQGLEKVLMDCFFDGSLAVSETAALFILNTTQTCSRACEIAEIVKSLPTAIPSTNTVPLARVSAFLAISFDNEACAAPLNTFCFSESYTKRIAVRTVIDFFHNMARDGANKLEKAFMRTNSFFEGMLKSGSELDRHAIVRGLISLCSMEDPVLGSKIISFLLQLDIRHSSFVSTEVVEGLPSDFETFFASEIASVIVDADSMRKLVLRTLVRCLELGNLLSFLTLWNRHEKIITNAIPVVGLDLLLYVLITVAAWNACQGDLHFCGLALQKVLLVLKAPSVSTKISGVLYAIISTTCTAIGSLCSVGGAIDASKNAAEIIHRLQHMHSSGTMASTAEVSQTIHRAQEEAIHSDSPRASLSLGLLMKLLSIWNTPVPLKDWLESDYMQMVTCRGIKQQSFASPPGIVESIVYDDNFQVRKELNTYTPDNIEQIFAPALFVGIVGLATLGHNHPRVRLSAVKSLALLDNSQVLLFFLPAVMMRLHEETNGVVVMQLIVDLIISPPLLLHSETCSVCLNALVQLFRRQGNHINTASYQTGLVALAIAAKYAPVGATALLLAEIVKLKTSFGLVRPTTRTSAAAAVLKLVQVRPTAGTKFIPFINLCISPESLEAAPGAAALCFGSMFVLCMNEIIDATKAVKIVLKRFPDILEVNIKARCSYIQLLGAASKGSNNEEGTLLSERAITILRRCITDLVPVSATVPSERDIENEAPLSWIQVKQAAESLELFTVDEILQKESLGEELTFDLQAEKERLERIGQESSIFTDRLLSSVEQARKAGNVAWKSIEKLLQKIVRYEWENRQRSRFDPEKTARLRMASEALRLARRARVHVKDTDGSSGDGAASDRFLRVVNGLPVGVVRVLYERCVKGGGNRNECDKGGRIGSGTAMGLVSRTGALYPALPWVSFAEEVYDEKGSSDQEKMSSIRILRLMGDENFFRTGGSRWFGFHSRLFDDQAQTSLGEVREMFVGMMQHQVAGGVSLLLKNKDAFCLETLHELVKCCAELQEDKESLHASAQGLFSMVSSNTNNISLEERKGLEKEFYQRCLRHCNETFVEDLLMDETNECSNASAIRLACLQGTYSLLRHVIPRILYCEENEEVDLKVLATVGEAVRRLASAPRREIVLDFCVIDEETDSNELREMKLSIAAYALGMGALLPGGRAALSCAVCLCEHEEHQTVERLVRAVMKGNERYCS